jgi:hypothetical protein
VIGVIRLIFAPNFVILFARVFLSELELLKMYDLSIGDITTFTGHACYVNQSYIIEAFYKYYHHCNK